MKKNKLHPIITWSIFSIVALLLVWNFSALGGKSDTVKTAAASHGLIFSHKNHLETYDAKCSTCHNAEKSVSGKDDLLPTHDNCGTCHDVKDSKACATCHIDGAPKRSARIEDYSAKFNHATHIDKAKLECKVCHKDLDAPLTMNAAGHLPLMKDCMKCHEQKLVSTECSKCHTKSDDLQPASHKLDWKHAHGMYASASNKECQMCHKQESCNNCHNGDIVFTPHPADYISHHGQEAHLSDITCSVCHEDRAFCNECHRTMNVLPAGHFGADWVSADGGKHSDQAAFDLESCMACHDVPGVDPVCAKCHRK
jgi:hypothetical protein